MKNSFSLNALTWKWHMCSYVVCIYIKISFTILALNGFAYSQWAKSVGGLANDYGNSISVDASGNVYVTGDFQGTADFDPGSGTTNLTSSGDYDIFFAKYNSSGELVWAKNVGGR